jgi:hypothetical protein
MRADIYGVLTVRGVAKNEDGPVIKWFLDNKALEPGVGSYQYGDTRVFTKRHENILIAIYKNEPGTKEGSAPRD